MSTLVRHSLACSQPGCLSYVHARGLCQKHYRRAFDVAVEPLERVLRTTTSRRWRRRPMGPREVPLRPEFVPDGKVPCARCDLLMVPPGDVCNVCASELNGYTALRMTA